MKVGIRADASVEIGTGHVMRCLTLAKALRASGNEVIFICREHPGNMISAVGSENGFSVFPLPRHPDEENELLGYEKWLGTSWQQDAKETALALSIAPNLDWLIVDHYGLNVDWERAMKAHARRLFVIDDLQDRLHECDLFLNQNFGAGPNDGAVRSLIGPQFAILRDEFLEAREKRHSRDTENKQVLVFFGGTDVTGEIVKVIENISSLGERIQLDIVLGRNNQQKSRIQSAVSNCKSVRIFESVNDMGAMMAKSDVFVGAGGTTTWERLCVGVPSIVVAAAENQISASLSLANAGFHHYLGESQFVTGKEIVEAINSLCQNSSLRERFSSAGKALVDGFGVTRILHEMILASLEVREAVVGDLDKLLELIPAAFNSSSSAKLKENKAKILKALSNPDEVILFGEYNNHVVGGVRYIIEGDVANVFAFVESERARSGMLAGLLQKGSSWLQEKRPAVKRVLWNGNFVTSAIKKIWLEAGFKEVGLRFEKEIKI